MIFCYIFFRIVLTKSIEMDLKNYLSRHLKTLFLFWYFDNIFTTFADSKQIVEASRRREQIKTDYVINRHE